MTVTLSFLLLVATATVPEDLDAAIVALLPPSPLQASPGVRVDATAGQHAEMLRRHPAHGKQFWVRGIAGDSLAPRILFLFPQYHRNLTTPIAWTTLGREIAEVQQNIDLLVRVLAFRHHLTCIGTEGTSRSRLAYSSELRQLAWWQAELDRGARAVMQEVAEEAPAVGAAVETTVRLLEKAIRQHAIYLDGVGAAQSRLAGELSLHRFGTEEEGSHTEALALLDEVKAVEEELARLDPRTEPEAAGIVGQMWLREIPAYERGTLGPWRRALESLGRARDELRKRGREEESKAVAAWLARVARIGAALIAAEEVIATTDYYRSLPSSQGDTSAPEPRLTAAQQRRRKSLLARQTELYQRYERVTRQRREQVAARKVLERLSRPEHGVCAVVMGAGHEEGLLTELARRAKEVGQSIAIITVAPYFFD